MAQPFYKVCGIACNKRLGPETTALRYAFLALRPNPSRPAWVATPHRGLWRLPTTPLQKPEFPTRAFLALGGILRLDYRKKCCRSTAYAASFRPLGKGAPRLGCVGTIA